MSNPSSDAILKAITKLATEIENYGNQADAEKLYFLAQAFVLLRPQDEQNRGGKIASF